MNAETPPEIVNFLLHAGISEPFELQQLTGGGNNLVFKVVTKQNDLLLKQYFYHQADQRDRLRNELLFYGFLESIQLHRCPGLVASDHEARMALFEFIEGVRPRSGHATLSELSNFFKTINHNRNSIAAKRLPVASEAFFTIVDHLGCIERRLMRLQSIAPETAIDNAALEFIAAELIPEWQNTKSRILDTAKEMNVDPCTVLAEPERCISPSDFGFHNSVQKRNGELSFFDFEYAGWDEPAKMLADLFTQVASPVPLAHLSPFVSDITSIFPSPQVHRERTALLLPAYQIKWCTIILNHFLAVDLKRRDFSGETKDLVEKKVSQLQKARTTLAGCKDAQIATLDLLKSA